MNQYETKAKYNIAETCASSISISELQELSDDRKNVPLAISSRKLTYGSIRGSAELRENLANLYSSKAPTPLTLDNLLITPGAIAANLTVLYAMVGRGDHVICQWPTYQQLYAVPARLGADVSLWKANEAKNWHLDINDLEALIRPNTRLIIINNPINPTGQIISKGTLQSISAIAEKAKITILSDEVYRPLFHSISPASDDFPPSMLNVPYSKTIVTGSMSKAYSLAGIRVGWIATRLEAIMSACAMARDFTTISVSQLDDQVAAFALSQDCIHNLLSRNLKLAKTNLALLEQFVDSHKWACQWTRPVAGTTAFIKFVKMGRAVDDVVFCKDLIDKTGVMFCPGSHCFGDGEDLRGYVRVITSFMMSGEAWLYLLAVLINAVNLFLQVFFTIMYSDLECDYINPIDLCNRLNTYIVPEAAVHAFLTTLFLINGYWVALILNLPLVAYNAKKIYENQHLLDATEIFRKLNVHKKESFIKLGFHLLMFFFYLYSMIVALIRDESH
ncbi:uncharacterized protein KY384_001980 [Bacidia gigantensis]|uniref:uncharacterized protein n=1 Tax=Bacidia gigantensis TaxID=2732470 RepID=UPI001D0393AE|nr:uncharacterized protein KY384_001980 [Bacidia gigantensis]KAG8533197.1 hypothetical protein KY384_001980 [Bacidia gigantensis]